MTVRQTAFEAIGTHWNIQVTDVVDNEAWVQLMECIYLRIQAFDKTYSRFRNDSLITHMSQQAGTFELPADGHQLLAFYERLYKASSGKITPLIGQVIADAGYDKTYSFQTKKLVKPPAWEDVISYTPSTITVKEPTLLDLGAAGKGYLVDIVSETLLNAGHQTYTINAGGDILHRSKSGEALPVGLENPHDPTEAIGIAQIVNQSLCASSGSKRNWGKYHHLIDPAILQSPTEIISTWVIANDTMTADGIATALFFTEPATLKKRFDFSCAILHKDMTLYHDKDFPVTVFKAD